MSQMGDNFYAVPIRQIESFNLVKEVLEDKNQNKFLGVEDGKLTVRTRNIWDKIFAFIGFTTGIISDEAQQYLREEVRKAQSSGLHKFVVVDKALIEKFGGGKKTHGIFGAVFSFHDPIGGGVLRQIKGYDVNKIRGYQDITSAIEDRHIDVKSAVKAGHIDPLIAIKHGFIKLQEAEEQGLLKLESLPEESYTEGVNDTPETDYDRGSIFSENTNFEGDLGRRKIYVNGEEIVLSAEDEKKEPSAKAESKKTALFLKFEEYGVTDPERKRQLGCLMTQGLEDTLRRRLAQTGIVGNLGGALQEVHYNFDKETGKVTVSRVGVVPMKKLPPGHGGAEKKRSKTEEVKEVDVVVSLEVKAELAQFQVGGGSPPSFKVTNRSSIETLHQKISQGKLSLNDAIQQKLITPQEAVKQKLITLQGAFEQELISPEQAVKQKLITPEQAVKQELITPQEAVKQKLITLQGAFEQELITPEQAVKQRLITPEQAVKQKLITVSEAVEQKLLDDVSAATLFQEFLPPLEEGETRSLGILLSTAQEHGYMPYGSSRRSLNFAEVPDIIFGAEHGWFDKSGKTFEQAKKKDLEIDEKAWIQANAFRRLSNIGTLDLVGRWPHADGVQERPICIYSEAGEVIGGLTHRNEFAKTFSGEELKESLKKQLQEQGVELSEDKCYLILELLTQTPLIETPEQFRLLFDVIYPQFLIGGFDSRELRITVEKKNIVVSATMHPYIFDSSDPKKTKLKEFDVRKVFTIPLEGEGSFEVNLEVAEPVEDLDERYDAYTIADKARSRARSLGGVKRGDQIVAGDNLPPDRSLGGENLGDSGLGIPVEDKKNVDVAPVSEPSIASSLGPIDDGDFPTILAPPSQEEDQKLMAAEEPTIDASRGAEAPRLKFDKSEDARLKFDESEVRLFQNSQNSRGKKKDT